MLFVEPGSPGGVQGAVWAYSEPRLWRAFRYRSGSGNAVFPAGKQDADPFKGQGSYRNVVSFASGDLGLIIGDSDVGGLSRCVRNPPIYDSLRQPG